MKKVLGLILIVVGSILLVGGLAFLVSKSVSPAVASSGFLSAETDSYDFKTISIGGGTVSHNFILDNSSSEPVQIEKVFTSCMCTTAYVGDSDNSLLGPFGMEGMGNYLELANLTIQPKSHAIVKAVFDPAAHGPAGVGLAERTIYIQTNSSKTPQVQLSFRAIVTP
ncbi:DUF1573 domain-containing protein [Patescibacteria group bacterium]|nr:DUF1573 domain-containing protein [Patescibacteria group bacterium]